MRLAAALEQYDGECAELVRTWLDMELYTEVSGLVDEMRTCCEWFPELSVRWVAFLISHSELMFCLWQSGSGNSRGPEVQACARNHSATLRHLRKGCARVCEKLQGCSRH
jgi:hypothetical protein